VSTVLTYAGAIRCDRTETKRKKKKLSKKEEVRNSRGKEETSMCGGVMFSLQMDGYQKQKDAGTLNELPRFIEAAIQK
jgi:hypothetical protein